MSIVKRFWEDEAGSSSVEYVALGAVSITLGMIAVSNIEGGAAEAGLEIERSINDDPSDVPLRVVYNPDLFDVMIEELKEFELPDLKMMSGFAETVSLIAEDYPDLLGEPLTQELSDLNLALDLTWEGMGTPRPTGESWSLQDIEDLMSRMGHEDFVADLEETEEEAAADTVSGDG